MEVSSGEAWVRKNKEGRGPIGGKTKIYIYMYIHIHRERARARDKEREGERQ